MKKTLLLYYALFVAATVLAQSSTQPAIDTSFNPNDIGKGNSDGPSGGINTSILLSDGKIIIGGYYRCYNGIGSNNISRIEPNGKLDSTFNIGGGANYSVRSMNLQPDGKIIVGGDFTTFNGVNKSGIVRINADGSLDSTFNSGTGTNGYSIYATALQSDGKIIIGGNFTTYNGMYRVRIARLNTDGSLDNTFSIGTGANNTVNTIAIQSDGKIIIGGDFTTYNGVTRNRIIRLNANGTIDNSFNIGTGAVSTVNKILIQSDGKIIVGGAFSIFNGVQKGHIIRLDTNGSFDNTFSGTGADNIIKMVNIQPDGKILIGGTFFNVNGVNRRYMARLNPDGSLDPSFDPLLTNTLVPYTTNILPNGSIIVGGFYNLFYYNFGRMLLTRLNNDGSPDFNFNYGTGFNNRVSTTALQPDGKILIGGEFTSYNGVPKKFIARLNPNGNLDSTFISTGPNAAVTSIAIQTDGKIIIGGVFSVYEDIVTRGIARLNPDGSLDTAFNYNGGFFPSYVYNITIQPDDKILVGGGFSSFNGISRNDIARLNLDGSLDTTFLTGYTGGANGTIRSMVLQPDGRIVIGGSFSTYSGVSRNLIARINTDGSLDNSFDPGTGGTYISNPSIYAMALQPNGKIIIGGLLSSYNGTNRPGLARINADGSLDNSFNPSFSQVSNINPFISGTLLQPDGKIVIGGQFTSINGIAGTYVTRLNPNGSLDHSFNCGSGLSWGCFGGWNIISFTMQPDGKLIIGGGFTSYNGVGKNRILRLLNYSPVTFNDVQTACGSYTWIDGNTYTSSNNTATYNFVGGAANGLDSLVALELTISYPSTAIHTVKACNAYTWIDGNTYTSSNHTATYNIIGGTSAGCDSLVTLNLTISTLPSTGTHTVTACNTYTWIDGHTYTTNNNTATYNIIGGASSGCDSLVTLDLTINHSAIGTHTVAACDSYTWIDGNTYTTSNNNSTYNIIGGASSGCDSLVTLNLTINNSATNIQTITACGSYTWIDGNTYTTNNNTATYNIIGGTSTGCDSLMMLNLSFYALDTSVSASITTLTANTTDANYQWLDCNKGYAEINGATNQTFNPSINGTYAVAITKSNCSDTSSCFSMVVDRTVETNLTNGLRVYPNPFSSQTTLESDLALNNATLTISNCLGQTLIQMNNLYGHSVKIERNNLVAGMYFIKLTEDKKPIKTTKIIIHD